MNVTLVFPAVGQKKNAPYIKSWQMEPLAMAVLASLTPKDVNLCFYDDRIEIIPYDRPTDVVGLSVETYTAKRAYGIANEFRQRGIKVVMGGYHPTLVPDEALEHADAIVIGEAEGCWKRLLGDVERGTLKKVYQSEKSNGLKGIIPDRRIFQGKSYFDLTLIETGRGCPFQCNFCSVTAFHRGTYRRRPVSEIVAEIRSVGKKYIFFVDDNIIADQQSALELFEALIPLNINWISQGTLDIAKHDKMLALMAKSGCLGLLIGFESLSKENLVQMGKFHNSQFDDYLAVVRKFRDYGIVIYGTFVFGYDYDYEETFKKSLSLAKESQLFLAAFNHLVPFPGTPLYARLEQEGKLLYPKWWLDSNYCFGDVAFRPARMTAIELSEKCVWGRRKFFHPLSILKRGLDFQANCKTLKRVSTFLLTNLLLRKEIDERKGLPLGTR